MSRTGILSATKYPDLFQSLAEPFPDGEVKRRKAGQGRTVVYITARQAMNRLDTVLGPENWTEAYQVVCAPVEGRSGVICTLTITLPDGSRVEKVGFGGFKPMTERKDGPIDAENTFKTAESDAFKRAAAKLGIARDLYQDGTVDFGPPAGAEGEPTRTPPREAPRRASSKVVARALAKWALHEPGSGPDGSLTEGEAVAREKRLFNRIVSDAIAGGLKVGGQPAEGLVLNPATGKRDKAKMRDCFERLLAEHRKKVLDLIATYLEEKAGDPDDDPELPDDDGEFAGMSDQEAREALGPGASG